MDRIELMKVLKIENSSTFIPIEIKKGDSGFGDTTLKYTLKFEISKDENTYICYVREYEYNENRKELFNELKKLK